MCSDQPSSLIVDGAHTAAGHDEGEGEHDVGEVAGREGDDEEGLLAVGIVLGEGVGEGEEEWVHKDVIAEDEAGEELLR